MKSIATKLSACAITTYYSIKHGSGPWMPAWQWEEETHTCSRWLYQQTEDYLPHCKCTFLGLQSRKKAKRMMSEDKLTSNLASNTVLYASDGRVNGVFVRRRISAAITNSAAAAWEVAEAAVSFKHDMSLPASETRFTDADGTIAMADGKRFLVHMTYRQLLTNGEASTSMTTKATMGLPHACELVVAKENTTEEWRLVCDDLTSASTHYNLLWPSDPPVKSCFVRISNKAPWTTTAFPPWLQDMLSVLSIPISPSINQEQPCLPANLRLRQIEFSRRGNKISYRHHGILF